VNRLPLFSWLLIAAGAAASEGPLQLGSPDGSVLVRLEANNGGLAYSITLNGRPVIERSPLQFTVDGLHLTSGTGLGQLQTYRINELYPWWGAHSQATNHCLGARIIQGQGASQFFIDWRVFNEGVAFRFIQPAAEGSHVPDEGSKFVLPSGATVWHHDLEGHYEGVHSKNDIAGLQAEQWLAPPVTFQLPDGAGYAAITEAGLSNYSGMALQADGRKGLQVRLGHQHPPSRPYKLRYSPEDIERLSKPAAVIGPIATPWRIIMIARDLNGLVNNDMVPNLSSPPDPRLFPQGLATNWVRPGRAVWKYLDGGGDNSLSTMKDFTRWASELGFEYHVVEGFWSRWSDADMKELVADAKEKNVGLFLWKHSRTLREPQARHEFFKRCHELGVAGAKIDFFDHEAKEVIDLYQALLKEAAEYRLLLNFHGANKPAGESRTWPNELTREAVRGMEASRLTNRATHDVTLPFTRMLAGPAEYTPLLFGPRRQNTTWSHQIASPAIFSTPLLTYGIHPGNLLTNPCVDMIRSIPPVWDETQVLPPSEIGELAIFARRTGKVWFLAIMNGLAPRKIQVPLTFLGSGTYRTTLVRDLPDETASQVNLTAVLRRTHSLTVDLSRGGGCLARFTPN
jgi:alpha-glucosidase